MVRAAVETFARSCFDRLSRILEALATGILEAAELPSDPRDTYLVSSDGLWATIDAETSLDAKQHDADLPLDVAVAFSGYPADLAEGYAARLLVLLQRARLERGAGNIDEAMAFAVGEMANEPGMKDLFEADLIAGERVRAGGHEAHKRFMEPQRRRRSGKGPTSRSSIAYGRPERTRCWPMS